MPEIAYYPGCSLLSIARDINEILFDVFREFGFSLKEVEDWNCCGSSSAHNINPDVSKRLAWRILAKSTPFKEILVICPNCYYRLKEGLYALRFSSNQEEFYSFFGCEPPLDIKIVHFLEFLSRLDWSSFPILKLKNLKLAPYYGCSLFSPSHLSSEVLRMGILEGILKKLGAEVILWRYATQCCGTYLSVVRPDLITEIISQFMLESQKKGIEALVTPCVMCQFNIEIRCKTTKTVPVFHLIEIVALSLRKIEKKCLKHHFIDPVPLLEEKGLI